MKFFVISALFILTLSLISSCGATRGAHCDAYGSTNYVSNVEDLAQK